jgi:hypothetical protein
VSVRTCTGCERETGQTPTGAVAPNGWLTLRCDVCGSADEYPPEPVLEVARAIVDGRPFHDSDAVRVAREYIAITGARGPT